MCTKIRRIHFCHLWILPKIKPPAEFAGGFRSYSVDQIACTVDLTTEVIVAVLILNPRLKS